MPLFQIEEFGSLGRMAASVPQYPPVAIQQSTSFATSTALSAFNASTNYVRVVSDTACYFKIAATSPTAAANSTSSYLPAGVVVDIGVSPGHFLSVIAA